jgi:hypothetical protein
VPPSSTRHRNLLNYRRTKWSFILLFFNLKSIYCQSSGDRKFWIEEDWTEDGIAADLVRAGVPKEDIVLAFHEPGMRQYTDFAAAS